jgi:hypothetical protein
LTPGRDPATFDAGKQLLARKGRRLAGSGEKVLGRWLAREGTRDAVCIRKRSRGQRYEGR